MNKTHFFNPYTMISVPAGLKIWTGLCPNHNPSGTLHTLTEQEIQLYKAPNQPGSSNSNVIQGYPFRSSSHSKLGTRWRTRACGHMCADASSCSFLEDPCVMLVAGVGRNLCQRDSLCLELERITPCKVLNLKTFGENR